jgi:hypothetical protein
VIFQRYAKDVEAVQQQYERQKRRPPLPRFAPPVAGHIQWARQLLRRIEPPMMQCAHGPGHSTSFTCLFLFGFLAFHGLSM